MEQEIARQTFLAGIMAGVGTCILVIPYLFLHSFLSRSAQKWAGTLAGGLAVGVSFAFVLYWNDVDIAFPAGEAVEWLVWFSLFMGVYAVIDHALSGRNIRLYMGRFLVGTLLVGFLIESKVFGHPDYTMSYGEGLMYLVPLSAGFPLLLYALESTRKSTGTVRTAGLFFLVTIALTATILFSKTATTGIRAGGITGAAGALVLLPFLPRVPGVPFLVKGGLYPLAGMMIGVLMYAYFFASLHLLPLILIVMALPLTLLIRYLPWKTVSISMDILRVLVLVLAISSGLFLQHQYEFAEDSEEETPVEEEEDGPEIDYSEHY